MRRPFRTTRGRLVLLHVAILTVAAGLTSLAAFELVTVPAHNQLEQVLFDQWSAVADALDLQNGRVVYPAGRLPAASVDTQQPVETDVYAENGLVIQTERQSLSPGYLAQLARTVLRSGGRAGPVKVRDSGGGGRLVYAAAQPVGEGPGRAEAAVIVSVSTDDVDLMTQHLLWGLLAGDVLVIVVGGSLAWALVGRTLRPVRAITTAAREISTQDLRRRVTVPAANDEVGELKATFNEMLGRLERSFASLSRFVADASHELRTPLTLMRAEVDFALERERGPHEQERVLRLLRREIDHLGHVADQLLLLVRADAGELVPLAAAVDVADLVEEVGVRWRRLATERGLELSVEAPSSGTVSADPHQLRQVLDNLLDNAFRHSPEGGRVELRAGRVDGEWRFEVADQGGGVPAGLQERLFEPFSRADGARSRRSGGAGLGLALGAAVARAHGGSLELVPGNGRPGATFRLRLPDRAPTP